MTEEQLQRLQGLPGPLLAWFDENARILPWREEPTPYRVWVSEIMLQQTRVEAVKPYFQRFLEALPDVGALAACPEDRLLKLWEGLGYYNRARNLQEAARTVMRDYGGKLPSDPAKLLKLKGIGSYTAGAIASIAYGVPAPAVDGNVLRVISRITANEEDIARDQTKKAAEAAVCSILPEGRAGAFNQALMELGALVCVPGGPPKCPDCPARELCLARLQGRQEELPVKAKPRPRRREERTVLLIRDGERVELRRRPKRGLLAGLYEFPNETGHLSEEEALAAVKKQGLSPLRIRRLREARHVFSHVEWQMLGYMILVEEPQGGLPGECLFAECEDAQERFAIPAAFSAYTDYLKIRLGQKKYGTDPDTKE